MLFFDNSMTCVRLMTLTLTGRAVGLKPVCFCLRHSSVSVR